MEEQRKHQKISIPLNLAKLMKNYATNHEKKLYEVYEEATIEFLIRRGLIKEDNEKYHPTNLKLP